MITSTAGSLHPFPYIPLLSNHRPPSHIATGIRDWPKFISQAYRHLAPGGLYELSEHNFGSVYSDDDTIPEDSGLQAYAKHCFKAMAMAGVDVSHSGEDYKRMMEEAGFVDVKLYTFKYPWGSWPKDKKLKYVGTLA